MICGSGAGRPCHWCLGRRTGNACVPHCSQQIPYRFTNVVSRFFIIMHQSEAPRITRALCEIFQIGGTDANVFVVYFVLFTVTPINESRRTLSYFRFTRIMRSLQQEQNNTWPSQRVQCQWQTQSWSTDTHTQIDSRRLYALECEK